MTDSYITVLTKSHKEFVINKSRFIGYACPCSTEEEALSFIQNLREQYRDATHHCYAYIVGQNRGIMRYSDDGEPGGTAGMPMMDVMKKTGVVNCCVVVVRYFGGTLLGTGGLVRAYTQGCKEALIASKIVRMEKTAHILCEVPYSVWDSLQHAAQSLPLRILNPEFAASITFTLVVRSNDLEDITEAVRRITGRQIEMIPEEEIYDSWDISGSIPSLL